MSRTPTKQIKKGAALLRVSTRRQGRTGFGLAAQRRIIDYYFNTNNIVLVKVFIEIGSGRPRKRPKTQKTIEYCRKHDLTLYVANQSRLARNAGFIYDLIDSKFEYTPIDMPHADKTQRMFQAVIDEKAADDISANTKNSLESARGKGVKFGGNSKKRKKTMRRKNKAFLKKMRPIIQNMRRRGITTQRGILEELNRRKIRTYHKKTGWHVSTVHKLLHDLTTKTK